MPIPEAKERKEHTSAFGCEVRGVRDVHCDQYRRGNGRALERVVGGPERRC